MQKLTEFFLYAKKNFQTAFVKNSSWIVAERVYQMILSLIISIFTARFLGPDNLGIITYAASFVAAFLPIATFSMEYVVIRELVQYPEKSGEILGSGILLRLISGFLSVLIIVALVSTLKPQNTQYLVVTVLSSISLLCYSLVLIESWLQAQLQSKYATIIKSIAYTVMSAYKVFILVMKKDVTWFAFASSLDMIIVVFLYAFLYFGKRSQRISISGGMLKLLISQSFPFVLSGMMVVAYGQLDRIILEQHHGPGVLGQYGTASTLCYMWQFIPAAIITSARPIILKFKGNDDRAYIRRLKQIYAFIWWLSIVVALVLTITGDWIVITLYGTDFSGSANALKILTWSQGFSLLAGVRTIWFVAEDKNKYLVLVQAVSAAFSILVYFLLIPPFGITGAAVAILLSQMFIALASTLFHPQTRESSKLILDAILLRF